MVRVLLLLPCGVRLGRIGIGTTLRRVIGTVPRCDPQLRHYVSYTEATVEIAPAAVKAARRSDPEERAAIDRRCRAMLA